MAGGRRLVWLGTGRFVENRDGEILGLGRRVRAPTGLRLGLGLGFCADVAGSRPKSGMTRETPPMVMVTGCSLALGGSVGGGLTGGLGLMMLFAVGGVRVFATDARSFCLLLSNLSLFPTSRPISKYVASEGGSL